MARGLTTFSMRVSCTVSAVFVHCRAVIHLSLRPLWLTCDDEISVFLTKFDENSYVKVPSEVQPLFP